MPLPPRHAIAVLSLLATSACPRGFDDGIGAASVEAGTATDWTPIGGSGSTGGSADGSTGSTTSAASTGSSTESEPPTGCGSAEPLTAAEQMLVDMPADSWLRIPEGYRAVCDDTFELEWHLIEGCSAVINDWSGGVWDPRTRQLLLWGGGSGGYAGNEVYAFSTASFTWSALTEPSLGPYDRDPLDDGMPVSRHTYNGLVWVEPMERMLAWGGVRATDGLGTNLTWLFDPSTTEWSNPPGTDVPSSTVDAAMVYDSGRERILAKFPSGIYEMDPGSNAWTLLDGLGFPPYWPRYYGGNPTGALDTKRNLAWFVGGGQYLVWDIALGEPVTDDWVTIGGGDFDNGLGEMYPEQAFTSGGGAVIREPAPGLDYEPGVDQIVAWVGGGPWELDLATKAWTRKGDAGAPGEDLARGTFGRWRYLCEYNVFILVNSMDDVYFYKHTAGA